MVSEIIYLIVIYFKGHYFWANTLGFVISVLNAYFWNNYFVFKENNGEQRVWWMVLFKLYASYFLSYIINVLLLFIWIDVLHISNYVSFLMYLNRYLPLRNLDEFFWGQLCAEGINCVLMIPINFVLNKKWVFKG